MYTRITRSGLVIVVLFMLGIAPASAMELETGEWQIVMQTQNPMTGQPISKTSVECIKDSRFDPAQQMMSDNTCRVIDKQETDDSVSWKIECGGGDMPVFHGEGRFVSHGKTAEGEMKMIMTMGTTTMEMNNNWSGKYVSSTCSSP